MKPSFTSNIFVPLVITFSPAKKCVGFPYNHSGKNKGEKYILPLVTEKKYTTKKKQKKTIPLCKLSRLSWESLPPRPGDAKKMWIEGISFARHRHRHRHLHLEPFQHGAHATDLLKTKWRLHNNCKHKFPICSQYTFTTIVSISHICSQYTFNFL